MKKPMLSEDVTDTYKKYIVLYIDALGFREISLNTSIKKGGLANSKLNGFFRRSSKFQKLISIYQNLGSKLSFLNMSDSFLLYEEITDLKDENITSSIASILGIGRQIQTDLLKLNGILCRGAIGVGIGSFGIIEGVYAGPILAELIKKEKQIELPIIYTPDEIVSRLSARQPTIREMALKQLGASDLEFATLKSGAKYPKYLNFDLSDDSFDARILKMIALEAAQNLYSKNRNVRKKWFWLVDQIIELDLPNLDGKGHSFLDFLNLHLNKRYITLKLIESLRSHLPFR